jgi:glutamate 5-kinase
LPASHRHHRSGRAALATSGRILVKLGARALLANALEIDRERLGRRVEALLRARAAGCSVRLVSAGAIGIGWPRLGYPDALHHPAAPGRGRGGAESLHAAAHRPAAAAWNARCAGVAHARQLPESSALSQPATRPQALQEAGALPVINKHDTVSVNEIRFRDNALLAALVVNAVDADLTVIFSEVHGLYDGETKRKEGSLDDILAGRPVGRPLPPCWPCSVRSRLPSMGTTAA